MAAWYRAGLEPAALALLALVVRLLHVRYTAKALVADDAVFFEEHAQRFLDAWAAIGTPGFAPLLREAVDHASLQGIVYPLFQSLVYGLAGGVQHTALLTAQAVLGALTVWLTYLTAREAFGRVAALAAGLLAATYPPFVLASGLLLAEALLLFIQALALYFLVRGLTRRLTWSRILGGFCIGLLMLRPAFQYAGPILFIALAAIGALGATPGAGARLRSAVQLAAPYLGGVLLVALPWLTVNGLVYGSFVWSRTGDAWQQVYWGIYPPNRGWWPPDSPVPPKYGVDSLPGAWAAGIEIEAHDLDYLEAAVDQVRATPLQALATVVNKLYQAYLHPFNTYAEHPPLVGPLAVPLHRLLGLLALAGLCLAWLRPAPAAVLGAALSATSLPFLASHIDVRYTIPAAQIGTSFAGLAVAQLGQALRHRATWPYVLGIALPFGAWAIGVPHLVGLAPGFAPWHAHLLNATLVCAAFVAAGWAAGRLLAVDGAADSRPLAAIWAGSSAVKPSARTLCLASGVAAGGLLAGIYG
ncbi:MAG: glycosyltransferase family 39 protein, partial [Chloroflexota bacterium]